MKRSVELQAMLLSLYETMSKDTVDTLLNHFTRQDGLLTIGTDGKEWWHGHETLRKMITVQFGEMGQVIFTGCEPEAYAEGSFGWGADRPTMNFTDGTKVPVRGTFVFHQEGGAWKVVQMHWSIGMDNEASFGKELPTQ